MATNRAGVAVLALISAATLAGCAGSGTVERSSPSVRSVPVPLNPTGPATAPGAGGTVAVPVSTTTTVPVAQVTAGSGGTNQYAGMSPSDWDSIDQAVSAAQSALSQSDADAAHN